MNITNLCSVAELSEPCLLTVAHTLATARDAEGMLSLMGWLSKNGFPGPLSAQDLRVDMESDKGKISLRLSDSILECLKAPETGAFLLDIFVTLHERNGTDLDPLLNRMLFRCASIPRGDIVTKLIELGADKSVMHASDRNSVPGRRFATPYEECLTEGNAEQAIAYVQTDRATAKEMAWAISRGHKGKGKSDEYPEALMLITNAMTFMDVERTGSLARLVVAIEDALGVGIARTVRARLLALHLRVSHQNLTQDRLAQINYLLEPQTQANESDSMWLRLQRLAVQTRCLQLSDVVARHANQIFVPDGTVMHSANGPGRRPDAHLS